MGPKVISQKARPHGVCRAGSSLAAHMLGYTGKTLVWWETVEKGPDTRLKSAASKGPFPDRVPVGTRVISQYSQGHLVGG